MEKRIQFRQWQSNRIQLETQLWPRIFAFTIDVFIIRLLLIPCFFAMSSLFTIFPGGQSDDLTNEGVSYSLKMNSGIIVGVYLIVFILYAAFLESSRLQGTLGKWFVRYTVCDTDGKRISLPRAMVRNALKVISILTVIGVFVIDMTHKRQSLHDLIAGTILIRR